jgi:hypothetical protein
MLRNDSRRTCWLAGYPTIQLASATGKPVQTIVSHRPAMVMPPHLRVRRVTLAPDATARVYVGYANAGDFVGVRGFAGCPASSRARVTPPGDRVPLTVTVSIGGAEEVRGHVRCGVLSVSPVTWAVSGWA